MHYTQVPKEMVAAFYELVDRKGQFDERDIKRITIPVDGDAEATFRGLKYANALKEVALERGDITYSYKYNMYFAQRQILKFG